LTEIIIESFLKFGGDDIIKDAETNDPFYENK